MKAWCSIIQLWGNQFHSSLFARDSVPLRQLISIKEYTRVRMKTFRSSLLNASNFLLFGDLKHFINWLSSSNIDYALCAKLREASNPHPPSFYLFLSNISIVCHWWSLLVSGNRRHIFFIRRRLWWDRGMFRNCPTFVFNFLLKFSTTTGKLLF